MANCFRRAALYTTGAAQEGRALGGRDATILWPGWQSGELPSCGVCAACNQRASLPAAYRLYLPEDWAADSKRRRKTGVPKEVVFKTKPEIAPEQIEAACKAGLPRGVVLMDAGYGCNTDLRTSVSALGLTYVAGIFSHTTVWTCDRRPLPPKKWSGQGRPTKRLRRDRSSGRSQSSNWLSSCPSALGTRSNGGRVAPRCYRRSLLECGFTPPITMTISPVSPRPNGSGFPSNFLGL
jgi:SRSO17 transposase